ncbi:unnamed protein product, partial [Ectocarpus sp. 12 AP-2014]
MVATSSATAVIPAAATTATATSSAVGATFGAVVVALSLLPSVLTFRRRSRFVRERRPPWLPTDRRLPTRLVHGAAAAAAAAVRSGRGRCPGGVLAARRGRGGARMNVRARHVGRGHGSPLACLPPTGAPTGATAGVPLATWRGAAAGSAAAPPSSLPANVTDVPFVGRAHAAAPFGDAAASARLTLQVPGGIVADRDRSTATPVRNIRLTRRPPGPVYPAVLAGVRVESLIATAAPRRQQPSTPRPAAAVRAIHPAILRLVLLVSV